MAASVRRRTFLAGLGTFAAYQGVLAAPARAIPASEWEKLRKMLGGKILLPNDTGYDDAAKPNNLRYAANKPQGIAMCMATSDVRTCMKWARDNNVPPIVRAGGHSYAGYSTTTGFLLDVKTMKGIDYSGADSTVTLKAGTLNGEVYKALSDKGLFMTHGRCANVGAAGYLLGGGIGFSMRNLGISSDSLVRTELVGTNGAVMTGGPGSDLLWAAQGGGGGSFGVSTSFTIKVEAAPRQAAVFVLYWTRPDPKELLRVMMPAFRHAPGEFGSKINVFARTDPNSGEPKVLALGQFVSSDRFPDPENSLRDILAPAMSGKFAPDDHAPNGGFTGIRTESYWDAQKTLEEAPAEVFIQEKSLFVDEFDDTAIDVAVDFAYKIPYDTDGDNCFKFFQTGVATNARQQGETAFVHRNSNWLFDIEVNWGSGTPKKQIDANLDWQQAFFRKIASMRHNSGSFQNFADPSLLGGEWQNSYFGANYRRLQHIKQALDPDNFLRNPQSIQPA